MHTHTQIKYMSHEWRVNEYILASVTQIRSFTYAHIYIYLYINWNRPSGIPYCWQKILYAPDFRRGFYFQCPGLPKWFWVSCDDSWIQWPSIRSSWSREMIKLDPRAMPRSCKNSSPRRVCPNILGPCMRIWNRAQGILIEASQMSQTGIEI